MRLHYPIQSACKIELVRFCAQVPAGQARRLSPVSPLDLPYTSLNQVPAGQARRLACLEAHAAEKDFGKGCAVVVRRAMRDSVHDYRLLPRLAKVRAEPNPSPSPNPNPNPTITLNPTLTLTLNPP